MKVFIKNTCQVTDSKAVKKKSSRRRTSRTNLYRRTSEVDENCIKAVDIYTDLTLMRQVLYTDLGIAAAGVNDTARSDQYLNQIKELQEEDKVTLEFLRDPMNNR